jgi:hypothetical protein
MTLGPLTVEILPLKKGNIVLTSHFPLSFFTLAGSGDEEGEGIIYLFAVQLANAKLTGQAEN